MFRVEVADSVCVRECRFIMTFSNMFASSFELTVSRCVRSMFLLVLTSVSLFPGAISSPAPSAPCTGAMDLALVLDGSGSVTPYWGLVEQFAVQAIEAFNVSADAVHIAITEFSSGEPPAWIVCSIPRPVTGCGLMDDKTALITMAKSLFNAGYGTAIGAGILEGNVALHAGALARPAARKVILLLSDGNNNFPPDPISAAVDTRAGGTEIYAVAVGQQRNTSALEAIVSAPTAQHLFMAEEYSSLLAALRNATSAMCDRYVCVDEAVCEPAQTGDHGITLAQCQVACHPKHHEAHY